MNDDFYSAFEDRFRGPRELIARRLAVYKAFLEPLAALFPAGAAVDLGCGRGEWLELLRDLGYAAVGIDLDDSMLAGCRSRGLQVRKADAIQFLQQLPDSSQCLVSAFHVVEHLPPEQVRELIGQAHRVLQPGGLLILETPNAENLTVGTSTFYLDPTHQRPVHPMTIAFMADYSGFDRAKVLRLNDQGLPEKAGITLLDVLSGVSPDCSVVAQKAGSPETKARLDAAFLQEWGISLPQISGLYDEATRDRVEAAVLVRFDEAMRASSATRELLLTEIAGLRAQIRAEMTGHHEQVQRASNELVGLREEIAQMRNQLSATHQALVAIHDSRSWRWTAPVRQARAMIRSIGGKILRRSVPLMRGMAHRTPWTKKFARSVLASSPFLAGFVGRFLKKPDAAPPAAPPPAPITLFKDLRSVRLMSAIARTEHNEGSLVFIGKDEHVA